MTWFQRRDPSRTPYAATVDDDGAAIYIHRVRAERALGKPLPKGAEVHHADGSKDENAPLVICQDRRYHAFLHNRMRVKAAGGNPRTDQICNGCKRVLPFWAFGKRASDYLGLREICKSCVSSANKAARTARTA